MANIKVVTLSNSDAGSIELHDNIAAAELSPFIIKDAVIGNLAAKRQGTHKAKGRSEVSGSRKKLFRQKGTGNARQGYPQSAHRRGGGVVFGPVPRDHSIKLNKKVRRKALASVIAEKIRQNQFIVVDNLNLDTHKTKDAIAVLAALNASNALLVTSVESNNMEIATRNLAGVKITSSGSLNVYDVLSYQTLVLTKDALQDIEGRLLQ